MQNLSSDNDFDSSVRDQINNLKAQIRALEDYLSARKIRQNSTNQTRLFSVEESAAKSPLEDENSTNRERLISVVKILVEQKNGKSVKIPDIIGYIEKNNVKMGKGTDMRFTVSSMLSQEVKRTKEGRDGKIKKVRRGMYNLVA